MNRWPSPLTVEERLAVTSSALEEAADNYIACVVMGYTTQRLIDVLVGDQDD